MNKAVVDPNKLRHIFDNPKHKLDGLLLSFSGNQAAAFCAIQEAANKELAAGKLVYDSRGTLPASGNVLNINGVLVQLFGGRVMNGKVIIGSAGEVVRMS